MISNLFLYQEDIVLYGVGIIMMNEEINSLLNDRFGKDSIIALATTENNIPHVRNVNSFYCEGCFYVLTYALSNKMRQINKNDIVAISGEWFTAHGRALNKGYFGLPDNKNIADKMREVFSAWIDNGHYNFDDENTVILAIELIDGVLFSDGKRIVL